MPNRILIITNRVPFPLKDGGAMAMDAMIRGYHDAGWEVFLLAMNTTRHYVDRRELEGLYPELHAFEAVDVDNRLRLAALAKNLLLSRNPEHADRFYNEHFRRKLERVMETFSPHVIQLESIYLNTYLDTIRQNSNAVLVQRLHNIECQIWKRLAAETRSPLRKWYLSILAGRIRLFEQEAWQDADLLLPITAADASVILNTGCTTEMHVTPFGIVPTSEPGELPSGEWQGYHIGAMDWRPNQDAMEWMIHGIWPLLHAELPGFRFSFAGRVMPDRLKHNLPQGMSCKGEVKGVEQFVSDKQILIVPLRSGGGIRVKILEAMAAGKLVISTTVGMQGIEAEPDTHFLLADTPEAFVRQVKSAITDQRAATAIARQGQLFVRKYYDRRQIMQGLLAKLGRTTNI